MVSKASCHLARALFSTGGLWWVVWGPRRMGSCTAVCFGFPLHSFELRRCGAPRPFMFSLLLCAGGNLRVCLPNDGIRNKTEREQEKPDRRWLKEPTPSASDKKNDGDL
ncbi:hypothetical protein Bca52824_032095 [Brassica carinata]|uniref:Secreted protein n=1 Tax=Brassica carinata TaxID=52824 RepID=A0A8X7SG70_BRACI|nr:hypothetical protein Bca52824_032095 [Brassica carinata]